MGESKATNIRICQNTNRNEININILNMKATWYNEYNFKSHEKEA